MSQTPVLQPNERRILRLEEVEAKSGFKRAHIYNLMKKRQFPQALRKQRARRHAAQAPATSPPRCFGNPPTS